jgi:hypothetical protein
MAGKTRNVLQILAEKPSGKRPLRRRDGKITFTLIFDKRNNMRLIEFISSTSFDSALEPRGTEQLSYARLGFSS